MSTVHLYDTATGRTRTIRTFGDGVQVRHSKTEVEAPERPPVDALVRRAAVRELTQHSPEQLAKREVLKRIPLQKLIAAAIEQGLFDRLNTDG